MGTEENKALARRFVEEVYNKGNVDAVDEFVSDRFVRHGIGGTMHGRDIIKERVKAVRTGFPDFRITIEEALADGDKVVLRQTHTGTHLGEFAGVLPTGASGCVMFGMVSRAERRSSSTFLTSPSIADLRSRSALPSAISSCFFAASFSFGMSCEISFARC